MSLAARTPQNTQWIYKRQSPSYFATSNTKYAQTLQVLGKDISAERNITSRNALSVAVDFYTFFEEWKKETLFSSSVEEIVLNRHYQRIIGLGPQVLPIIFKELQQEPQHLYWALQAITGCNPIQPEHQGNLDAMNKDWLEWALKRGYVDMVVC